MVLASRPVVPSWLLPGLLLAALLVPAAQAAGCAPEACTPIVPFAEGAYVDGDVAFVRFGATVTIRDAIAQTALELTLRNDGANATQAHVRLPLPDGAALLGFNLTVGDRVIAGHVMERAAAQATYDDAVEQGVDAALLRQADKRAVVLDLNVAPGQERTLRATYAELVPLAGGARAYRLPLSQLEPRPATFGLAIDVASRLGAMDLRAVGWSLDFEAGRASTNALPAQPADLLVLWREEAGVRSTLVTAAALQDGPTEALASICVDGLEPVARDAVFILDQSGSMAGVKIEEAREALVAAIATVTPRDRFAVIPFSNDDVPFAASLQEGTTTNVAAARTKAQALGIEGGTNLDAAIQEALRQLAASPSDRLPMVLLLTDGLPTVGIVDHDRILARAEQNNTRDAPFIVVPIGLDADYTFLADLALRTGGTFVDPGRPDAVLGDRLARLAQVLAGAQVKDIEVSIDGAEPGSILPRVLPPVYGDDCLDLRFRTDGSDTVSVQLHGIGAAGPVHVQDNFSAANTSVQPAVRNLWGQALVAELLADEHAATGSVQAVLHQAIVANATAYGVLSPYTSWVLVDMAPQTTSGTGATATGSLGYGSTGSGGASTGAAGGQSFDDEAGKKTPALGLVPLLAALALLGLARRR